MNRNSDQMIKEQLERIAKCYINGDDILIYTCDSDHAYEDDTESIFVNGSPEDSILSFIRNIPILVENFSSDVRTRIYGEAAEILYAGISSIELPNGSAEREG